MSRRSRRRARHGIESIEVCKVEALKNTEKERPEQNHPHGRKDTTTSTNTPTCEGPTPSSKTEGNSGTKQKERSNAITYWAMTVPVFLWSVFRQSVEFLDTYSGAVTAVATAVIAVLTWKYTAYSAKQWQTMQDANRVAQDSLNLSHRSYVTIGRQDGTIADFVIPNDRPSQNAEIVIYFRNSGHIPAKFSWGTMVGFLAAGGNKNSTGITYTHPFKGLPVRTRDIKTGSIGESGAADAIIAGDSIFVSTLGTISQKDMNELGPNNMGALILGMYEYCDELGTHSVRSFGLRYRSNAPVSNLSFDLAHEGPDGPDNMPLPKPTATKQYLPPCQISPELNR